MSAVPCKSSFPDAGARERPDTSGACTETVNSSLFPLARKTKEERKKKRRDDDLQTQGMLRDESYATVGGPSPAIIHYARLAVLAGRAGEISLALEPMPPVVQSSDCCSRRRVSILQGRGLETCWGSHKCLGMVKNGGRDLQLISQHACFTGAQGACTRVRTRPPAVGSSTESIFSRNGLARWRLWRD